MAEAASAPPCAAVRPRPKRPRAPRPRRAAPHSELDLALDAAAATPQPTPTTFAELGLDARLVRALAARDIHEPFAIQARALPDALAGRDVLGRAQTGFGQDAGLRPSAADPARGHHGPASRQGTPRPGPRPDPRARPAGRRRARPAGPQHGREHRHGLRGRVDQQADCPRARRRHRRGDARPASSTCWSGVPARSPTSRSPCSTRRTTWPTWASCPRSPASWTRHPRAASGCSSPRPWTAGSASW